MSSHNIKVTIIVENIKILIINNQSKILQEIVLKLSEPVSVTTHSIDIRAMWERNIIQRTCRVRASPGLLLPLRGNIERGGTEVLF